MRVRALRGYTLIELAIALALLGLVAVLLWRFGSVANQRIAETEAPQLLTEANQALVGFVAANHRLPCPDTSATGDGLEHCGGATIGRLPVVSLGLARSNLQNIRYGVYRNAVANLDAKPPLDRFAPLVTTTTTAYDPGTTFDYGSASAADTFLGNVNGIDFCHALRLAGIKVADAGSLKVLGSGGALVKNVAYALALPGARDADGDGNLFDGYNTAGSFAAPRQELSANYDDVVQIVDFGQLFDRMSCGGVLSAADHAHFNASTAAALMHAGFVNYKSQLQVTAELAAANTLLAGASLALATGDGLAASAGVSFATAEALLSVGITSGLVAISVITEIAAVASVVAAGVSLGLAMDAEAGAKQTILDFQPLLDESIALDSDIYTHAVTADAAGLY